MTATATMLPPHRTPTTPSPSQPALTGHLLPLDGIRGTAIVTVMIFHFALFSGIPVTGPLAQLWDLVSHVGWVGVDLFFVLSGFLITGILHDSKGKESYFRRFYTRRVFRIFPLYYGALAVFFLVLPAMFPSAAVVSAHTESQVWYWSYLVNVQIALDGWGATSPFLDHFWSLAVEEQFYFFWPIVVLVLSPRALLRFCGGIVLFSLAVRVYLFSIGGATAAFVLTPARMDPLAVGAAVAMMMRNPAWARALIRWSRPAGLAALVALAGVFAWRGGLDKNDAITGTIGMSLVAVAFGALLVWALVAPAAAASTRLFTSRWLRFFGKYSYALYVFHQPIALVLAALSIPAALLQVLGSSFLTQLAFAGIAGFLSVAAALVSWNLLEKHFLKLKDAVGNRQLAVGIGT